MQPNEHADIEAEITFVPTEQGGRKTPALSNYRPQFFYNGMDCDAVQQFPDVECALPGQTVRTLLEFTRPNFHAGRVNVGMEFLVREGSRVVAHGRVTKLLRLAELAESVGTHAGNVLCRRCDASFHIPELTRAKQVRLADLAHADRRLAATQLLRQISGIDLKDAKAVAMHITRSICHCHWCNERLPKPGQTECPKCSALNFDW